MANAAPSTIPTLQGQNIEDCSLEIDDVPLHVTLRIYFKPAKRHAFFRVLLPVELTVDNHAWRTCFFLDIPPDRVRTLSLHSHEAVPTISESQPTRQCLHFCFTEPGAIHLIGPREVPPGQLLARSAQATRIFQSLRVLLRQSAIHVLLSSAADSLPLQDCCQAVSNQGLFAAPLRRDPGLSSLRSLYLGKGGRTVFHDELQPSLPALLETAQQYRDCPPPTYIEAAALDPAPTLLPPSCPSTNASEHGKKRLRTRSPSPPSNASEKGKKRLRRRSPSLLSPNSSTPDYNTWEHFNLACGEREKMMAELLRRADKKEAALNKLMAETDAATRHLAAMIAAAKEREAALDERGNVPHTVGNVHAQVPADNLPAEEWPSEEIQSVGWVSDQGSSSSTISIASNVSERIQAYITTRLNQFNETIQERGYVTADDVTNILHDDGYIQEDAMVEAIEYAVDGVLDRVRDRIFDAFS